ncbi:sensor histidine kinase [Hymenobacter chitinivorans]|uniref:Histidine kinase n=1 Tax=Hymenobacter chitinivorans DSM 11115 TaxID=1121954 RepID=A0A2M9APU5_9BACT|nr:histidine kinase [Hymenobacter chitinivorans]PJJ47718.1 histidine kinase [Hymenobacter chitinivorans DSM 11115]
MPVQSPLLKKILVHFLIWICYIAYEGAFLTVVNGMQFNYWETGLNFALFAILFYANSLVLLPRLFAHRHYLLYGLNLIGLIMVFCGLRYVVAVFILPQLTQHVLYPYSSTKLFWGIALYRGVYFLLLSFGYWFSRNALRLEKQKRLNEEQLRSAERSLMEANLAFLKSQINPHFLFNALNFLYAQAYPHSEDTAKGILLLSDIMRYALKDDDNNGKVMLEKEVQHLQNYIAINQLRFNNRLQIRFEVLGSLQFLMILPLILITFVENCFKHGELGDPEAPLLIQIKTENNRLHFLTSNKKRHGPKEKTTGIGLVNTQKRLDLVYPDRYALVVTNEPEFYTCQLTIDL